MNFKVMITIVGELTQPRLNIGDFPIGIPPDNILGTSFPKSTGIVAYVDACL